LDPGKGHNFDEFVGVGKARLDDPARREALPKYCFSIPFTIGPRAPQSRETRTNPRQPLPDELDPPLKMSA
jgi:hypothetical protein